MEFAVPAEREWCRQNPDLEAATGEVPVEEGFVGGAACLTFHNVCLNSQTLTRSTQEVATPTSEKSGEQILAPISGHYEPGKLVALMGPSGAGKTTLLDILAGKKAPTEGTVHVNGRPRDELWNRIAAYVPQDDLIFAHLTVEEVLRFHKELKMQGDEQKVEEVLKVFGLSEVRNTWVGDPSKGLRGISGGQRRRLSVARAAWGARIIFCDEPTSGLSATDAKETIRYLRMLSEEHQALIIASIHQPRREVTRLFDELILLTKNPGRAVYQGPMKDLGDYISEVLRSTLPAKVNPTDFCMDLITPDAPGAKVSDFIERYNDLQSETIQRLVERELEKKRQSPMEILSTARELRCATLPAVRKSKFGTGFLTQLQVVFQRQLLLRRRDKIHFLGDVMGAVVKAVIFLLAYWEIGKKGAPLQTGFFFFVLMACSIDQVKTMPKMISERTIMKIETSEALYSEWAYILPFTVISLVQAFVVHALFLTLLWPSLSYPWELFKHVWFWSLMVSIVMDSMYLMLSGIAKDATAAQVMSLPFLLIFMLYNGFTVTAETCPSWLLWAIDISPVAYAMEAITVAAAEICVLDDEGRGPDCGQEGYLFPAIVDRLGYHARPRQALLVMCTSALLFRAIHVMSLKFLNNLKR